MDFSIGEFEEVGNTIKQFSSENATVVVGTVIDAEMSGDLRVTIVATGLGNAIRDEISRVKLIQQDNVNVDYKDFERPTVIRNKDVDNGAGSNEQDPDYLDIPAFLRRQAD